MSMCIICTSLWYILCQHASNATPTCSTLSSHSLHLTNQRNTMCSKGYSSPICMCVCVSLRWLLWPRYDALYSEHKEKQLKCRVFPENALLLTSVHYQHSMHTDSQPFLCRKCARSVDWLKHKHSNCFHNSLCVKGLYFSAFFITFGVNAYHPSSQGSASRILPLIIICLLLYM